MREIAERGAAERQLVTTALTHLAESHDPLAGWVVEGMCLNFEFPLARVTEKQVGKSAALEPLVPEELRAAWRRGQGIECGRSIARGIPSDLAVARGVAAGIPEAGREEYWLGVGFALARDGAADGLPGVLEKEIPADRRSIVLTGFGAGMRHGLGSEPCKRLLEAWRSRLGTAEQSALERGMLWPEYPRPLEL